jgi:homoserine dehydrogenase
VQEPHPADDLSGSDVARKLCILSRLVPGLSELEKGFESVPTETLIPEELANIATGAEFVERLPAFDAHYEKMRKEAEDAGQVLRYVGVIDAKNEKVKCGLERYAFDHPFASSLSGSDNIISFHSDRYAKRPLIVQGSGAGAEVTAMGVVADCLRVAERLL